MAMRSVPPLSSKLCTNLDDPEKENCLHAVVRRSNKSLGKRVLGENFASGDVFAVPKKLRKVSEQQRNDDDGHSMGFVDSLPLPQKNGNAASGWRIGHLQQQQQQQQQQQLVSPLAGDLKFTIKVQRHGRLSEEEACKDERPVCAGGFASLAPSSFLKLASSKSDCGITSGSTIITAVADFIVAAEKKSYCEEDGTHLEAPRKRPPTVANGFALVEEPIDTQEEEVVLAPPEVRNPFRINAASRVLNDRTQVAAVVRIQEEIVEAVAPAVRRRSSRRIALPVPLEETQVTAAAQTHEEDVVESGFTPAGKGSVITQETQASEIQERVTKPNSSAVRRSARSATLPVFTEKTQEVANRSQEKVVVPEGRRRRSFKRAVAAAVAPVLNEAAATPIEEDIVAVEVPSLRRSVRNAVLQQPSYYTEEIQTEEETESPRSYYTEAIDTEEETESPRFVAAEETPRFVSTDEIESASRTTIPVKKVTKVPQSWEESSWSHPKALRKSGGPKRPSSKGSASATTTTGQVGWASLSPSLTDTFACNFLEYKTVLRSFFLRC
jgi:hypothetical protein